MSDRFARQATGHREHLAVHPAVFVRQGPEQSPLGSGPPSGDRGEVTTRRPRPVLSIGRRDPFLLTYRSESRSREHHPARDPTRPRLLPQRSRCHLSPRSSGGWSPTHTQAKRPTASWRTPGPGADVNGSIEPSSGFDQTRLGSVRPPTPAFTPTPSPRPKALEELTAGATGDAVPGAHRRALRPADHGRARERQSAVRTPLGPGRSVPGSTPWRRGR
jgi:hypothetical protein